MADTPLAALHRVTYALPDGSLLFDDINESLGHETVALIGRNGSGKTTLGLLVAGDLAPSAGRIERSAAVYRVAQQAGPLRAASLAGLAQLDAPLAALRRLAAGEARDGDLDLVGERWDLEARWAAMLAQAGLDEAVPPHALSGGQRMLLALIGGLCSDAGLLVLDEPSNHLDARHRAFLARQLDEWRASGPGLLLITHDRNLLEHADRTIETRPPGLRRYGGGWDVVQAQRGAELEAAQDRLARARTERKREEAHLRAESERAARKSARGTRERHSGSQCKLLLDAMKDRADQSDGARVARQAKRRDDLRGAVAQAFAALDGALERPAFPDLEHMRVAPGQVAFSLDDVVAPWGPHMPLTWTARGAVRVAITGPNGCGKSTLLHLLAGALAPGSGRCQLPLEVALIDQSLHVLDHDAPLLGQLRRAATGHDEGRLRQFLAKAGLGAERLGQRCAELSGGEQMRAALLLSVLRQPPPRLLLLDEPTNHLDLHATEALEAMLRSWPGALVVVSHDERFLDGLGLTHRIRHEGERWCVTEKHAR